jgi:hypothetical protein
VDSWVDPRNLARMQQFQAHHAAAGGDTAGVPTATTSGGAGASASSSSSSVDVGNGGDGGEGESGGDACKRLEVAATFGTISEYFWLCSRCLHVGALASIQVCLAKPNIVSKTNRRCNVDSATAYERSVSVLAINR